MYYDYEMITNMGFDSPDAFVKDFVKQHPNCVIRFVSGGVYCDYDFDTQLSLSWAGAIE